MAAQPPPPSTIQHRTPNKSSLAKLLETKCPHSLHHLKQTHAQLTKLHFSDDSYIAGALVKLYSNPDLAAFSAAVNVFNAVTSPHVFLYNSIIRASLENNLFLHAVSYYVIMLTRGSKPNKYTFPPLLKACAAAGATGEGEQLQGHVLKLGFGDDKHVLSATIHMYANFGMIKQALKLLRAFKYGDIVCWNAAIDGCMKNGEVRAAEELFEITPCRNVATWNAMVSGYARNGMVEDSTRLFDEMPERDEISWSAVINGYIQCNRSADALAMFRKMMEENKSIGKFVLSTVLTACADAGALEQGRWVHAYIERNSLPLDTVLGTCLVDMYAKCGRLDLSEDMFIKLPCREISAWNAMIGGYASHGRAEEAIGLFLRMMMEKLKPNAITFIGLLNACAHSGLVEEGYKCFNMMQEEFGITPTVEHYGCIVDLLGRKGMFDEAEKVINSMPMKANAAIWGALLGACRIHGNVEMGERIGKLLLELEPNNSGRYAILSNIYAKAGKWGEVSSIRKIMKEKGIRTLPGISMIEIKGIVHEFTVGDCLHPRARETIAVLQEMLDKISVLGYIPNTTEVLFDIGEEEKESALCYHSEKLAIAFGLLNTVAGTTIRIVKNLRVCEDCHLATKLISKAYGREIVVRDRMRYHCFKDGKCSCGDFW